MPINQLPLGAWAGLLQELNEGRGGLVGPIARQNSLLRRQQWLVKLPITGLPCGLTQQTMVAMALKRRLQNGRLRKALAVHQMDANVLAQGLTKRAAF